MESETSWPRSLVGWLSAILLAVLAPALTTATAVAVEPGDSVHVGSKVGYGGTGLFPIWTQTPATGDPDYWAYCIEHDVPAEIGIEGHVGDLDSYLGDNYFTDPDAQGKVFWVLANSYPALSLEDFGAAAGVPGISRNDAIEATQYAIWRYTDLTWDADWPFETADSEAAYWYLVNGANANPGLTPVDIQVTVSVTAPDAPQTAGSLVGPFVVNTNQATASVSVDPSVPVTDASGNAVDADAVADGQELYLDLRGSASAGSATVTVAAEGSSATGKVVSVPTTSGATPTVDDHAQSIILVTPDTVKTTDEASIQWAAQPTTAKPVIGTSLVDAADGDRVLPWNGGTAIDTVDYRNLVPGTEYTLAGELMRKPGGTPTGITGQTRFTPTEANGSVDVTFVVPVGYAGEVLVAYERLFEGPDTSGNPIAVHEDLNDAAQTVTLEEAVVAKPVIGTSLVDAADGDRVLPWNGGAATDTVSYRNLTPGIEYTLTGELMRKADGAGTGITGSVTFTATAASGSVEVGFVVPEGYAGEALVALEQLFEGAAANGDPIAVHEDINDAAQTVAIEKEPDDTAAKPDANNPETLPSTGAGPLLGLASLVALLSVVAGVALVGRSRKA